MPKKNEFKDINKFIAWCKSKRPDEIYVVKNKERYNEVIEAIQTICQFALDTSPDETLITTNPDDLLGTSLCVEIISDMVVFDDMQKLCSALSKADNFEICARTDGKFSVGILFEDVYDFAPPQDSPFPEFEKGYGEPAYKRTLK